MKTPLATLFVLAVLSLSSCEMLFAPFFGPSPKPVEPTDSPSTTKPPTTTTTPPETPTAATVLPFAKALWAKKQTSVNSATSTFTAAAVTPDGNIVVAGYLSGFGGSVTFGTTTLLAGGNQMALIEFDPSGTVLWATTLSTPSENDITPQAVAVNQTTGDIYVSGTSWQIVHNTQNDGVDSFDLSPTVSFSRKDVLDQTSGNPDRAIPFLAKYSSSGVAVAVTSFAPAGVVNHDLGTGDDFEGQLTGLAVDGNGHVYASGYVKAQLGHQVTINLGNSKTLVVDSEIGDTAFLIKYDTDLLAQTVATVHQASVNLDYFALALDGSGNPVVAGYATGDSTVNFGNSVSASGKTGSTGSLHGLVVKYDSSLVAQWAKIDQSSAVMVNFASVAVDSAGRIDVAGYAHNTGTLALNGSVSATVGATDQATVVAQYSATGTPNWVRVSGGTDFTSGGNASLPVAQFYQLVTTANDDLYAFGLANRLGTYTFGDDVTATTDDPDGSWGNGIAVRYDSTGKALSALATKGSTANGGMFFQAATTDGTSIYAVGPLFGTSAQDFGNSITLSGGSTIGWSFVTKFE